MQDFPGLQDDWPSLALPPTLEEGVLFSVGEEAEETEDDNEQNAGSQALVREEVVSAVQHDPTAKKPSPEGARRSWVKDQSSEDPEDWNSSATQWGRFAWEDPEEEKDSEEGDGKAATASGEDRSKHNSNHNKQSRFSVIGAFLRGLTGGGSAEGKLKKETNNLKDTIALRSRIPGSQYNHEDGKDGLPSSEGLRLWRDEILPNFEDRVRSKWVQNLWRQGIPGAVRGQVWPKAIGNRLQLSESMFIDLVEASRQKSKMIPGMNEIITDIPRTNLKGKGVNKQQLAQVLGATAAFRPDIGYVQGMSYMGSMLMMFMGPVEAFICLANLVNLRFFPDFLQMNMIQIELRWKVFEILLGQEVPHLACHFDQIGFTADLVMTDWWYTLFCKDFPIEISTRLWDCFLLEGEPFLMRAAIGICKHLEPQLLGQDLEDCHRVLAIAGETISEKDFFASAQSVGVSTRFIREMLHNPQES